MNSKSGVKKETLESPSTILHFSLASPNGEACTWALNPCLGTLSQLAVRMASFPTLVRQQIFTPQEMRILLPLLQAYPEHCKHELLLAHLNSLDPQTLEERQGGRTEERDAPDRMLFLHHAVSRARIKAHGIGLEIISSPEKGYALRQLDPKEEDSYV